MKARDLTELLLLAAIWGSSFLFMRLGAGSFGPIALAGLRVLGASLFLLPLLVWRGEWLALRTHWRPIALVGLTNSALPFVFFGLAATVLPGGMSGILNATAPLWGAVIGVLWLGDRPDRWRTLGLCLGFGGVLWLASRKAAPAATADQMSATAAMVACLAATLLYGFSANFTKRYLQGVAPMALATGSQLSAALALSGPMLWMWPQHTPPLGAWGAVLALALLCTGVAYVLFFRLIGRMGATRAISVTFLIPAFAMLWGALFMHEPVTGVMLMACAVILLGTSLVTGLWSPGARLKA